MALTKIIRRQKQEADEHDPSALTDRERASLFASAASNLNTDEEGIKLLIVSHIGKHGSSFDEALSEIEALARTKSRRANLKRHLAELRAAHNERRGQSMASTKKGAAKKGGAKKESAPRERKPRQAPQALPGMEDRTIPEIQNAAEAYVTLRDEHAELTKQLKNAKTHLIEVMKKFKRNTYNYNGLAVEYDVKDEIHVRAQKDDDEGGGEG